MPEERWQTYPAVARHIDDSKRRSPNAICEYCSFHDCLIYRDGKFMCRDYEGCRKRTRDRKLPWKTETRPEGSGWDHDGVVRESDLRYDTEAYEARCAQRRGMTLEDYRGWKEERDRLWEVENARYRQQRIGEIREDRKRRRQHPTW